MTSRKPEVLEGLLQKARARSGQRLDLQGQEVESIIQEASLASKVRAHNPKPGDRILLTIPNDDGAYSSENLAEIADQLSQVFVGVSFTFLSGPSDMMVQSAE